MSELNKYGQDYDPAVHVASLEEHPDNPRRGNTEAIDASMSTHGFYGAVVAQRSTGRILAGNHRYRVAVERGAGTVPVLWLDVTDDQARRVLLTDNRTGDLAEYDYGALAGLLDELQGTDLGLDGTGWDAADLLDVLGEGDAPAGGGGYTDPDNVPDPLPDPVTKVGDVWQLGPHRVLCGDSTDLAAVKGFMGDTRADVVWTDPPYGVSYVGKTKDALTISNDGADDLDGMLGAAFDAILGVAAPGAAVYIAAPPGPQGISFATALADRGMFRQRLVWVKDSLVLGHSDYHYKHEDIYYGFTPATGGRVGRGGDGWYGDNAQTTILEFPRPKSSLDHPTMKPVELIAYCLGNSSRRGHVVLDLFGGSGSTLMAAHQSGRLARLVELDPVYVDVVCRRWQDHTGELPVLEASGEAHDFNLDDV